MNNKKGFTLIELMLVIIIIGILAAMSLPNLAGRTEEARRTRAKAEIEASFATALDMYELYGGNYPTTEQGLDALRNKPTTPPIPSEWKGPYLKRDPKDPWSRPYVYKSPGVHNEEDYDLYSVGCDGVEGTDDDVVNWQ